MTSSSAIRAVDVEKSFGQTRAVNRVALDVPTGSIAALLGPSGSGKTTLLRLIAGFDVPDGGTIEIAGRTVAGRDAFVEPEERRVGMVFQEGALFPHLTVADNVGFGKPHPGVAADILDLVGLGDRSRSFPHELSGGERQRVALARALAIEPEVVLLDEPFASLDAGLRVSLRDEVVRILRATDATALLVTHDQDEAMSIADNVTVMRDGTVEQRGTPEEVYLEPTSRWVAQFLGAAEILPGTIGDGVVECALGTFPAPRFRDGPAEVVVRPEQITPAVPDDERSATVGLVVERTFHGADVALRVALPDGTEVRSRVAGRARWQVGDAVQLSTESVTVLSPDPNPVAEHDPEVVGSPAGR